MSEMRTAAITAALLSKGFRQVPGRDHHYFFFNGRKRNIFTRYSHGETKADDWLIRQMAKQVRLSKAEFLAFVECTISGSDYAHLMVERGHLR
jgi:hypothetical protein